MMAPRIPFIGSGRHVELDGQLTTRKQDFNAHWQGGGFRHGADNIDMNPSLGGALAAPTVQETLEKLQTYIIGVNTLSIGDGVTTTGDFTVGDVSTPTIEDCFTAALATTRLSKGGWILIKSGLYNFVDTVILPAGISLMGSVGGTLLNATTSLSAGGKPMFKVGASTSYRFGSHASYLSDGYFKNKFINLSFADNANDIATWIPALDSATSAFIVGIEDSNIEVEYCTVLGKTKLGAGAAAKATTNFISVAPVGVVAYGNTLKVKDCTIQGVQSVVNFECDITMKNEFVFSNNRIWFFDATASATAYGVTFKPCNATLSGNKFNFTSVNTANPNVVPVCFTTGDVSSDIVDITIENNVMSTNMLKTNETNQLFRLVPTASTSGENKRFNIKGNLTGAVSDSDWYITVGDGTVSVGDVNGERALAYLSHYYSNLMSSTLPTFVNYSNQLTVFVRPGNYLIDSDFNPLGIGAKLVGLVESGNLPMITITNPVNAAPGGITLDGGAINILLGTHLENLCFQYNGAVTYFRLVSFVGLNNPTSLSSYAERYVVRNCTFRNCGLYPRTVTAMGTRKLQVSIDIDFCRFYASANHNNVSIVLDKSYSAVKITNCSWDSLNGGAEFCGHIVSNVHGWNAGETFNSEVFIDGCSMYIGATTTALSTVNYSPIRFNSLQKLVFTNNYFDMSAASNIFDNILYSDDPVNEINCNVRVSNNKFVGNDLRQRSVNIALYGLNIAHLFGNCEIKNNIFQNIPLGVYLANVESSGNSYIIDVSNNSYYSGTKGFVFVAVFDLSTGDPTGNIFIHDNVINCSAQNIVNTLAPNLGILQNGVITVQSFFENSGGAVHIHTSIKNNNIFNVKFSNNVLAEQAAIAVNGIISSKIDNNFIVGSNDIMANTFGISCIMYDHNVLGAFTTFDNSSCAITHNTINMNVSTNVFIGINCRNINFININENTIIALNNIATFISAYSDPVYTTAKMDGNIVGNIFNKSLPYEITYTPITGYVATETYTKEIIMHKEAVSYDTRIRVEYNKNQKALIDIPCTSFIGYGINENADGYYNAFTMLKDLAKIEAWSNAANLNRAQQHMKQKGLILSAGDGNEIISTDTDGMPNSALYYTNTWRTWKNVGDPMIEAGSPPTGHYQHQILIPIDVPNNCEILRLDIPVYYFYINTAPFVNNIIETSASWIFGNDFSTDGINYIQDNVGVPINVWAKRTTILSPGARADNFRLINDTIGTQNTMINESWLNNTVTTGVPFPKTYILVSMNRQISGSILENDRSLVFAIPYCRVLIRY